MILGAAYCETYMVVAVADDAVAELGIT